MAFAMAWVCSSNVHAQEPEHPTCQLDTWLPRHALEQIGLEPSPGDLVVELPHAVAAFDAAVAASLPPDGGVVILGEHHYQAATHTILRRIVRQSEVIDCLLLEETSSAHGAIFVYQLTELCPFEDGVPARICRAPLVRRLIRAASVGQRAVYPVDACLDCPPFADLFDPATQRLRPISDEEFADLILAKRNEIMAAQIEQLFSEGRCRVALMQTGRAHFLPPDVWGLDDITHLDEHLTSLGLPNVAWPIVDVHGEVDHIRAPRPARVRFVQRDQVTTAIFIE